MSCNGNANHLENHTQILSNFARYARKDFLFIWFALQLSTAPGDSEAIDVWFVMLDRPNLYLRSSQKIYAGSSAQGSASRLSNRPRLISISEAYRNLAQLISQRDIPLKLPLNKDREVIARLRKHSLQVAPESVYPSSSRRGSYRFLRASYTAGSMAGLGFSMVILGICIGNVQPLLLSADFKPFVYF